MPRQARKRAESGIYHIMLRGINQQQIFEDKEDCQKYLQILRECKEICDFKLLAYCLMGNYIHLLIKEGKESLEQMFKRIGGRFVYWKHRGRFCVLTRLLNYRRQGNLPPAYKGVKHLPGRKPFTYATENALK